MNETYLAIAGKEFAAQTEYNWRKSHIKEFVTTEIQNDDSYVYGIILQSDLPHEDDTQEEWAKPRGFKCEINIKTKKVTTIYNLYSNMK